MVGSQSGQEASDMSQERPFPADSKEAGRDSWGHACRP